MASPYHAPLCKASYPPLQRYQLLLHHHQNFDLVLTQLQHLTQQQRDNPVRSLILIAN
jgi:hypothetical protein